MKIQQITLNNIGPYIGENTITFNTGDASKNIILIGGRNGAGKTTLFDGVSLKEIQEWLGHSDISTTSNIYTHLDYSSKVSSANAILSVFPAQ